MPQLGYIIPAKRTPEQQQAHELAESMMPVFALDYKEPAGPKKVVLTDFFDNLEVIADIGYKFNGFWQLTGSCAGASAGNGTCTLSAIQRVVGDEPTKAFVPFWPFFYGKTRQAEGDRGQGEGAVVSIIGRIIATLGMFDEHQDGLPAFKMTDNGICLTKQVEFQWSEGAKIDQKWLEVAKPNTLGTRVPLTSIEQMRACLLNGYPIHTGNAMYVGNGILHGSGAEAIVTGKYDTSGGHATTYQGVWDHPNFGPHYLYWNQWPTQTYPDDPSGPRCSVWVPEAEVDRRLFRSGRDQGETYGMSHLNYLKAQPKVLDWFIAP